MVDHPPLFHTVAPDGTRVRFQPELLERGKCRHCEEEIGWVHLRDLAIPVDPVPHPRGEFVLLPDGHHVISLQDPEVQRRLRPHYGENPDETFDAFHRFLAHRLTCSMPGVHTVGTSMRNFFGAQRAWEAREEFRRRLVAADKRRYG